MRGLFKTRLNKLEAGLPDEAEQQQMHQRIERARTRIMAAMTPDERAEYLAGLAERANQGRNTSGQRGRSMSLADRLHAARTAS